MEALVDVYESYAAQMREEGYYDYNDRILTQSRCLRKCRRRLDLEEQYQYILVDEFQDTNDAQTRLPAFWRNMKSMKAAEYYGSRRWRSSNL